MEAFARQANDLPEALRATSPEQVAEGEVRLEGEAPAWLRGTLLRSAPAVFDLGPWHAAHWFDALTLLARFRFDGAGAVHWRRRLLDCQYAREVRRGSTGLASFATPATRSLGQRLLHPIPDSTDNTNVTLRHVDGQWIGMTETERILAIDPCSLETLRELNFQDHLPERVLTMAHPRDDLLRGEEVNIGVRFGPRSMVIAFRRRYGRQEREEIGRIWLGDVPYLHSFALTERYVVITLGSLMLTPWRLLGARRPYGELLRWHPGRGARLCLIDRASGKVSSFEGPPCFVFHSVQAFEEQDGSLVVDQLAYDDPATLCQGMGMAAMRRDGVPPVRALPKRWRVRPGQRRFEVEVLSSTVPLEYPAVDDRGRPGQAVRQLWGSQLHHLVRFDLQSRAAQRVAAPLGLIGEPVFVARPGSREEGDGVLLTLASGSGRDETELTVWDPMSLEARARARFDFAMPLGFHGGFALST